MDPCTSSITLSKAVLRNSLAQRKVLLKVVLHKDSDYLRYSTVAIGAGRSATCVLCKYEKPFFIIQQISSTIRFTSEEG